MNAILRTIHSLSVSLWFGAVAFFTVAGLLIFGAFDAESQKKERPTWFPLPAEYAKSPPADSNFPDPLSKEQGSRAAGVAVGAIFPFYFGLQAGCAVAAALTALALCRGRLGTARAVVCVLALALVAAGWWVEGRVHELRKPRNDLTDVVLKADAPTTEQVAEARAARATFGMWHGVSLLLNFGVLGLTLAAAVMIPHQPPKPA